MSFFWYTRHQCFASLSVQNGGSRYLLAVTCAHWFIIMHSTGQKHATVWTNKKQGFKLCGSRFPDMCILKSKLYGLPEKIEAEKTGQSARGRESSHTSLNDNLWDQDCIPVMAPIHTPEREKKSQHQLCKLLQQLSENIAYWDHYHCNHIKVKSLLIVSKCICVDQECKQEEERTDI